MMSTFLKIGNELKKTVKWFGIRKSKDQEIDIEARNIRHDINGSTFELFVKNEFKTTVKTSLIGDHNIENILAAISIASGANISFESSAKSIEKFLGVGRRMQLLMERDGFKVIDDYAHHPTELKATIGAVEKIKRKKKLLVFLSLTGSLELKSAGKILFTRLACWIKFICYQFTLRVKNR